MAMAMKKKLLTLVVPFMHRGTGETRSLLLGRKLRGFGEGLLNGFGGKLENGEGVCDAAVRELQEECGVRVSIDRMRTSRCGRIHFLFHANDDDAGDAGNGLQKSEPALWEVHVFFLRFNDMDVAQIGPSDEMEPEWFEETKIPYTYAPSLDSLAYACIHKDNSEHARTHKREREMEGGEGKRRQFSLWR